MPTLVPSSSKQPYWRSDCGNYEVWHADCREVLPLLSSVDSIVTDPPYGIAHRCNFAERGRGNLAHCNDYEDVQDDDKPFDPSPFLRYENVVLWGANWYADKLPPSGGWLVWDKERPDDLDQATCELAWTSKVRGVRRFKHLWNGMMKASERNESYHPTQKPVALFEWTLSLRWILDVKTVLDPFMGSGPCGVACVNCGRRYVGIDTNENYCKVAVGRIQRAMMERGLMHRPSMEDAAVSLPFRGGV